VLEAAARALGAQVRLRRVPGTGGVRSVGWLGSWAAPVAAEDVD